MIDSILDAIGRTPLVLLNKLTEGLQAKVAVKVEMTNPGGSVKDRVAVAMIGEAEARGLLRPGGTIIEATAGNTGVGLAMVAAVRGYRCIFVLPDKMSAEKIALLKAYGAEVVITQTAVPPDSPKATTSPGSALAHEIPARGDPTSSPTSRTPRSTTAPPAPRSGKTPRARSPCSWPASAPGGTISGVGISEGA
ncbi:MAG: pyridoxal-phosphate dependent enzyme [Gemmataceae bacterium]